ncbi:GIY-YIG nuclease family protein [Pedobacter soli]|uniref:Putative endonuclease n=1 Tax=Pedobacter soli TaxID=390242 RepID=A0A1G6MN77_9SPHI|nr:GIY-YIG nuclease family protein [Pedobacter soli]SDC56456.1 putative endonuclease [Pedobacter soli]
MKTYTVYILKCADSSYYTGVTNDIDRRIYEHENAVNPTCYTAGRRPLVLVFCEHFEDVNEAIEFEKQVKGWSRKKKEAIINDNWDKLRPLSVCNNITSHKNYKKQ